MSRFISAALFLVGAFVVAIPAMADAQSTSALDMLCVPSYDYTCEKGQPHKQGKACGYGLIVMNSEVQGICVAENKAQETSYKTADGTWANGSESGGTASQSGTSPGSGPAEVTPANPITLPQTQPSPEDTTQNTPQDQNVPSPNNSLLDRTLDWFDGNQTSAPSQDTGNLSPSENANTIDFGTSPAFTSQTNAFEQGTNLNQPVTPSEQFTPDTYQPQVTITDLSQPMGSLTGITQSQPDIQNADSSVNPSFTQQLANDFQNTFDPEARDVRATLYTPGAGGDNGGYYGSHDNYLDPSVPNIAAGPTSGYSFGDVLKLNYPDTNSFVYGPVVDTCPGCGSGIDLTPAAASAVGLTQEQGVGTMQVSVVASTGNADGATQMAIALNNNPDALNPWSNNNPPAVNNFSYTAQNFTALSTPETWAEVPSESSGPELASGEPLPPVTTEPVTSEPLPPSGEQAQQADREALAEQQTAEDNPAATPQPTPLENFFRSPGSFADVPIPDQPTGEQITSEILASQNVTPTPNQVVTSDFAALGPTPNQVVASDFNSLSSPNQVVSSDFNSLAVPQTPTPETIASNQQAAIDVQNQTEAAGTVERGIEPNPVPQTIQAEIQASVANPTPQTTQAEIQASLANPVPVTTQAEVQASLANPAAVNAVSKYAYDWTPDVTNPPAQTIQAEIQAPVANPTPQTTQAEIQAPLNNTQAPVSASAGGTGSEINAPLAGATDERANIANTFTYTSDSQVNPGDTGSVGAAALISPGMSAQQDEAVGGVIDKLGANKDFLSDYCPTCSYKSGQIVYPDNATVNASALQQFQSQANTVASTYYPSLNPGLVNSLGEPSSSALPGSTPVGQGGIGSDYVASQGTSNVFEGASAQPIPYVSAASPFGSSNQDGSNNATSPTLSQTITAEFNSFSPFSQRLNSEMTDTLLAPTYSYESFQTASGGFPSASDNTVGTTQQTDQTQTSGAVQSEIQTANPETDNRLQESDNQSPPTVLTATASAPTPMQSVQSRLNNALNFVQQAQTSANNGGSNNLTQQQYNYLRSVGTAAGAGSNIPSYQDAASQFNFWGGWTGIAGSKTVSKIQNAISNQGK